jgi:hypothetical protein
MVVTFFWKKNNKIIEIKNLSISALGLKGGGILGMISGKKATERELGEGGGSIEHVP